MSDGTHISWSDATWNVVSGCTRVSEGCRRCYIERTPPFRMAGRRFNGPEIGASTGVQLHPDRLDQPLRWRKPRRIFVCSLADLFHDEVPDRYIAEVFRRMAYAGQHVYQVLTKRPARMRALLSSDRFRDMAARAYPWPLPNVWAGVSVEDQHWASIRLDALRATPAAVRWVSAEPLLGPLDLTPWLADLDWVVVGGESGPGARPMLAGWLHDLQQQCAAAGVPFYMKQAGEVLAREWGCSDRKGHNPAEWPELFPREYPA